MKKLFLIVLLSIGLSLPCWADSSLTFTWSPNLEADLAGYRLYQSDTSGEYIFGEDSSIATIPAGTVQKLSGRYNTETVTIDHIQNGTWFWVLTAFDNSLAKNESLPSNEVTALINTSIPKAPTTFKIQAWQKNLEVK